MPATCSVRISFQYWRENERRRAGSFGNMFNEIYRFRPGILHPKHEFLRKIAKIKKKLLVFRKKVVSLHTDSGMNPTARAGSR